MMEGSLGMLTLSGKHVTCVARLRSICLANACPGVTVIAGHGPMTSIGIHVAVLSLRVRLLS